MSVYLPPKNAAASVFNSADFNYQNAKLTVKDLTLQLDEYDQKDVSHDADIATLQGEMAILAPKTPAITSIHVGSGVTAAAFNNNTSFGQNSLTVAAYHGNTSIGSDSMRYTKSTGSLGYNTSIGYAAHLGVDTVTTGSKNTAVGALAMTGITTGVGNASVGYDAGSDITTGSNNLLLGQDSGTASSPSGSVTIGSNVVCIGNSSITDIYQAVSSTIISDARDKIEIQPLDELCEPLQYILDLKPKAYRINDRSKYFDISTVAGENGDAPQTVRTQVANDGSRADNSYSVGFLSQDIQAVEQGMLPNTIVCNDSNLDKLGLRYLALIPMLVGSIQSLTDQLADAVSRIEELENV